MGRMLGERMVLARVEKNMNVAELSRASDTSASHLHRIEDGDREPSYKILVRIANALNVNVDELLRLQALDRGFPTEEELSNTGDDPRSIGDIRKEVDRRLDNMSKFDLAVLDSLLNTYFR